MTETEYLQAHVILTNEVEDALKSLYTYIEIDEFVRSDPLVLHRMNSHPEFWNTINYSLQTLFIIALGRVLDKSTDSHSIHNLLKDTINHPEYFCRDALAARKRKAINGPDPDWLESYLDEAWQPNSSDLEKLRSALKPISDQYDDTFKPIRNKIFAHRGRLDRAGIGVLVNKGLTSELEKILYFLHDLLACLWHLIHNGAEPKLGTGRYDYEKRARTATRGALSPLLRPDQEALI